jgi:hypothetical protein
MGVAECESCDYHVQHEGVPSHLLPALAQQQQQAASAEIAAKEEKKKAMKVGAV